MEKNKNDTAANEADLLKVALGVSVFANIVWIVTFAVFAYKVF